MININKLLLGLGALLTFTACDYEDINTDKYGMTDEQGAYDGVGVGGQITVMEQNVIPVGTQADGTSIANQYQVAYHLSADVWSGYFGENNNWGGGYNNTTFYLNEYWLAATYNNSYTKMLGPWKKLREAAEKNNTPEVFALAQILKISGWHKTLECFGPMPYTHAGAATLAIPFDSEEEVYHCMFAELDSAITVLTDRALKGMSVMGDFDAVYAGDVTKWVKYANSLMLRLAMRVRFADEALSRQYATKALTHSLGVMTAKDDAAQMSEGAGFKYINNLPVLAEQYNECRMGTSIFCYLFGYQDPRIPAYFKPCDDGTWCQATFEGKKYGAIPMGNVRGPDRYYQDDTSKPNVVDATPTYWMRASEVYFLRAEAALVWGGEFGDPASLYTQGIQMSFDENGVTSSVAAYMASGRRPTAHADLWGEGTFRVASTATPAFSGTNEEKFEKIMIQKWLALYPNGQEAWTEWRRTGYPKLQQILNNMGAANGITKQDGIRRMTYPPSFRVSEATLAVYEEAVSKLRGGTDRATTRLWWDCKP